VPDDRPEQEGAQQGEPGDGTGEEAGDDERPDDQRGERGQPSPPRDVRDDDEGHEGHDEHVERVRPTGRASRSGERRKDLGELVVEDEGLDEHGQARGDPGGDEGVDELPRAPTHEQVDADADRQDEHADAGDPGEELEHEARQPPGRHGEVGLEGVRRADREVGEGDRHGREHGIPEKQVDVRGAPHPLAHGRFDHLDGGRLPGGTGHRTILPHARRPRGAAGPSVSRRCGRRPP